IPTLSLHDALPISATPTPRESPTSASSTGTPVTSSSQATGTPTGETPSVYIDLPMEPSTSETHSRPASPTSPSVSADPSTGQSPAGAGTDPAVSIILPALNEAEALPLVVSDIREVLGRGVEIVVVDDGSTDATAQVAENLETVLVRHPTNRGKGAAMASGVEAAGGDLIIFMDADATYPAGALPQLIEMLGDHGLGRGERPLASEAIPPINRLGNRVFNRLIGGFPQIPGRDIMSGLYGMHRRVFEQHDLESSGFDIEVESWIRARQLRLYVGLFPTNFLPRVCDKRFKPVPIRRYILLRP